MGIQGLLPCLKDITVHTNLSEFAGEKVIDGLHSLSPGELTFWTCRLVWTHTFGCIDLHMYQAMSWLRTNPQGGKP